MGRYCHLVTCRTPSPRGKAALHKTNQLQKVANLGGFSVTYGLGAVKDAIGSFSIGIYGIAGLCLVALLYTIMLARMKPLAREGSRSVKVPG